MVKIKSYKIRKQGIRGLVISLPKVWADDQRLQTGDKVDFYRDEQDRLILVANKNDADQG